MKDACARAEILAGAIALGEATQAERDDYRGHIATCASCLRSLGGEREIERVMATVAQAKDGETWEPSPRRVDARSRRPLWRAGVAVGIAAAAIAASLGIHAFLAASVRAPVAIARTAPAPVVHALHVSLEHRARSTPRPVAKVAVRPRSIVVVHNVITRHGNAVTQTTTQTTLAEASVPHIVVPASNVPIWRRTEAMPSPRSVAATAAPVLAAGRAESMVVAPPTVVRDVAPLGGDAAINPHPALIAYKQGAQGTTAFEVHVDERGIPVKCTITKSSGYLSLDDAVCKAAMAARYSPRTVNGKPISGIYRDAFTFRATDEDDADLATPYPF